MNSLSRRLGLAILTLSVALFAPFVGHSEAQTPAQASLNCVISIGGRGFHIPGEASVFQDNNTTPLNSVLITISSKGFNVVNAISSHIKLNNVSNNVGIIVADDFSGNQLNATVQNQIFATLSSGQPMPPNLDLSHGAFVLQHLNKIIEATGLYTLQSNPPPNITNWLSRNNYLMVRSFDTKADVKVIDSQTIQMTNNDTQTIADGLTQAIKSVDTQRVVVNLNFVVLPCKNIKDYLTIHSQQPDKTVESYLQDTQVQRAMSTFLNALKTNRQGYFGPDPLYQLIHNGIPGYNIVFVAPAGDYGSNSPILSNPGQWDTVISVSASADQTLRITNSGTLWGPSSPGKVMLPGTGYELQNPFYYGSTAFAAPVMSVIAALYLTQDPIHCPFDTTPPKLATFSPNNLSYDAALNTISCYP